MLEIASIEGPSGLDLFLGQLSGLLCFQGCCYESPYFCRRISAHHHNAAQGPSHDLIWLVTFHADHMYSVCPGFDCAGVYPAFNELAQCPLLRTTHGLGALSSMSGCYIGLVTRLRAAYTHRTLMQWLDAYLPA